MVWGGEGGVSTDVVSMLISVLFLFSFIQNIHLKYCHGPACVG